MARFFALGLLGADYDRSPYTQTGEPVTIVEDQDAQEDDDDPGL